ncbi:MAG: hypothetical protein IJ158_10575 [Treponema sp.]|nr:hypothetical protein [Treponema sp.]
MATRAHSLPCSFGFSTFRYSLYSFATLQNGYAAPTILNAQALASDTNIQYIKIAPRWW